MIPGGTAGPGMERKDLLAKNAGIFKVQGKILNDIASKDVKVRAPLVVPPPSIHRPHIFISSYIWIDTIPNAPTQRPNVPKPR